MITESSVEYKGYVVKLRAATNNGFWYSIIKPHPHVLSPNGMRNIILRRRGWHFIAANVLLKKATDYIDNHPKELETTLLYKITILNERQSSKSSI